MIKEVSETEFAALLDQIARHRSAMANALPSERECLRVMFGAWERLQELGWRAIMYCPKDGTVFDSISAGSTGIHDCYYEGKWPSGRWWVLDGGDLWPANPIMWRAKARGIEPEHGDVGSAGQEGEAR